MAKITAEHKHSYFEKIKPYKEMIDGILNRERNMLALIQKEPQTGAFKKLVLSEEMLNLASYYLVMNGISQAILGVKNEDALNEARKSLYKSIIYLEELVTNLIDAPYSEYEEKLALLEGVDITRRYTLVRKLGLAIRLVEDGYGENTKWKWAFVEIEGRFATVAKNLFDLKSAVAGMDPRSPDYEVTVYYLRTIKRLLSQAADRYREKYELSTLRFDDFKQAINYLAALKRIHILMGEREEAETVKKKQEIWAAKLEADQKKQQEGQR
ncbi:MAG: hypothetical protein N2Z76_07890 [Treponemataceae bacterium]|nr:hypothetical protein [Treponemataceae bacterium]